MTKPRLACALIAALIGVACELQAGWIHLKAFVAQQLIVVAWERVRRGEVDARPWPWADAAAVGRLTILTGPPAADSSTLLAPSGTFAPASRQKAWVVLEGSSGRNLAFAPSHDSATVLPGEKGNSVISAHRDTHFRVLETLRVGDRLQVERADGRLALFEVNDVSVVDSRRVRIVLDHDAPRLTLVTCYPFDAIQPGGPLRFVVTADAIAGAGLTPPQRVARRGGVHL